MVTVESELSKTNYSKSNFNKDQEYSQPESSASNKKCSEKFEDFSWVKMNDEWITKLLSDSFMVKDSLPDGNCQFRSIQTALTCAGYKTTHDRLRKLVAKYIRQTTDEEFYNILQTYKLEKLNGEFRGEWNPFLIKTRRDFTNNIIRGGFFFEGDSITLSLLSNAIGIDFVIFDNNSFNIMNLGDRNKTRGVDKLIILYYIQNPDSKSGHYKTVGYKLPNGKLVSLFKKNKLPKAIEAVLDKKSFIITHIKKLIDDKDSLQLTFAQFIDKLEGSIKQKLSQNDIDKISKLLKDELINKIT